MLAQVQTTRVQATRRSAQAVIGRRPTVVVRAEEAAAAPAAAKKKEPKAPWVQPTLNPDTPSPIFGGSTGGLLKKAQQEEFYVITWESKKEQIFEMPTGGAAIMRQGPNLLKFAKKEQCLALTTQLRTKYKYEPCFYRCEVFTCGKAAILMPRHWLGVASPLALVAT